MILVTYMSDWAIGQMLELMPDEHYPMNLNKRDMQNLILSLKVAYDHGDLWAGDFCSTIAQTIGIEFV